MFHGKTIIQKRFFFQTIPQTLWHIPVPLPPCPPPPLSLSLSLSLIHTHTRARAHTHTHTHTRARTHAHTRERVRQTRKKARNTNNRKRGKATKRTAELYSSSRVGDCCQTNRKDKDRKGQRWTDRLVRSLVRPVGCLLVAFLLS